MKLWMNTAQKIQMVCTILRGTIFVKIHFYVFNFYNALVGISNNQPFACQSSSYKRDTVLFVMYRKLRSCFCFCWKILGVEVKEMWQLLEFKPLSFRPFLVSMIILNLGKDILVWMKLWSLIIKFSIGIRVINFIVINFSVSTNNNCAMGCFYLL